MLETSAGPTTQASTLLTAAEREQAMRLLARTGLLAGMLEGLIAEQLQAQAERDALQARVRHLEARVADQAPGPLLSAGAFSRIQRAQQARDDLRADLQRLRERYADAPDPDDPDAAPQNAASLAPAAPVPPISRQRPWLSPRR